ncbi:MAG: tetratricopeptide repeat protein [Betaproteobacteria bacterium]|nr:MAG: tetratricopeptide repeat protein [Betaproteobacteria bacterium]
MTSPTRRGTRGAFLLSALALACLGLQPAVGQTPPDTETTVAQAAPSNSELDGPLFYQVLVGEIELREGQAGTAYEVILDAARRAHDEQLFKRAVEIAVQGHAGEQALGAAKAWRAALPESMDAHRHVVQLLIALNRFGDVAEPLGSLLSIAPPEERAGIISALPRYFQRAGDKRAAVGVLEEVLKPYQEMPATRTASRVALGRGWLAAGDVPRALALAERAHGEEPNAMGPALLALDLLPGTPTAERIVTEYLATPEATPALRLAYARVLTGTQRYSDAIVQLGAVTRAQPQWPAPWLSLGALHLELRQPKPAEEALQRYVQLAQAAAAPRVRDDDDEDEPTLGAASDDGLTQAWLLLAQAAEQRGDLKAAEGWLARIDNPQRALDVQFRRASLLMRQGKAKEARALVQAVPERNAEDARAKLLAEAQLLRDGKRWREAADVLAGANGRFPEDVELLYEQAMVDEKLDRLDEMEKLLRRVIEIKPDHQHAYNALGYSLADRNLRLPEAKQLIQKALQITPGEPFITDSLGWVEYRLGNRDEAVRLLRQAYAARPDIEIAAHLGEVLWVSGQRDEARRVLRDARQRDGKNEVLREMLGRLKVDL